MRIHKYNKFVEARLGDIATIYSNDPHIFNNEIIDDKDNFIKYKTLSNRINNKKVRLEIEWNHTLKHDLIRRIKERTNLKSIDELNILVDNGLDELFSENYPYISFSGRYSLWFSEYNFSIIVSINHINQTTKKINIITLVPAKASGSVINIIELKSSII